MGTYDNTPTIRNDHHHRSMSSSPRQNVTNSSSNNNNNSNGIGIVQSPATLRRQRRASPNNQKTTTEPIDAWCDDGSVSRAEPPWLRDRRLKLHGGRDSTSTAIASQILRSKATTAATTSSSTSNTNTIGIKPHNVNNNNNNNNNPFDSSVSTATDTSSSSPEEMYKNPFAAPIIPSLSHRSSQQQQQQQQSSSSSPTSISSTYNNNPFGSPPRPLQQQQTQQQQGQPQQQPRTNNNTNTTATNSRSSNHNSTVLLQRRTTPTTSNRTNNPFEPSNNPFDTSTDESSSSLPQPPPPPPSSSTTATKPSSPRYRNALPPLPVPAPAPAPKSSPFQKPRKQTVNPFDSSFEEDLSLDLSKKDNASVALDSLEQILDTTDETVEESYDDDESPPPPPPPQPQSQQEHSQQLHGEVQRQQEELERQELEERRQRQQELLQQQQQQQQIELEQQQQRLRNEQEQNERLERRKELQKQQEQQQKQMRRLKQQHQRRLQQQQQQKHQLHQRSTPTFSFDESSAASTPSDVAIQAAEKLKKSFDQPSPRSSASASVSTSTSTSSLPRTPNSALRYSPRNTNNNNTNGRLTSPNSRFRNSVSTPTIPETSTIQEQQVQEEQLRFSTPKNRPVITPPSNPVQPMPKFQRHPSPEDLPTWKQVSRNAVVTPPSARSSSLSPGGRQQYSSPGGNNDNNNNTNNNNNIHGIIRRQERPSPSPSRSVQFSPVIQRQLSSPVDLDLTPESSSTSADTEHDSQRRQVIQQNELPSLLGQPSVISSSSNHSSSNFSVDASHTTVSSAATTTTTTTTATTVDPRLALHDLCDEARSMDDLAWHNALYLLSVQPELCKEAEPECEMNPLHVCCLSAPPIWMIRALLYTRSEQCQETDIGGRLPLHLCVATTADLDTMQLLVQEYPESISHKDKRGFTPLHLLLKNDQITLTLEHLRIMLGQTVKDASKDGKRPKPTIIHFRKGEHLDAGLQELEAMQKQQEEHHESMFQDYPDNVRVCLNKITQWKRRQITKGNMKPPELKNMAYDYIQPASIPTPTGKMLPLHLLVRRKRNENDLPVTIHHSKIVPPAASTLDLCRVLIHAYPQALITLDAHGRTPLLTAMIQSESSLPSNEVLETLLGLRTAQPLDISPAKFAADDTHQLPLHVAAEEMTHDFELLSTICEAYPEGITKQDIRGRTPLHLALANYQSIPVDEALLELLSSNKLVATTRDHDGYRPLDWIIEHPQCLIQRNSDNDNSLVFQQFLDDSISPPKGWRGSNELIRQLQNLPPWLRHQACASKYVQEAIFEHLTKPICTFWVLLWGCVLVALLVMIRILWNEPQPPKHYVLTVYILASYLLAVQAIRLIFALCRGEFYRLFLSNPWAYIHWLSGALSILFAHSMDTEASMFQSLSIWGNDNNTNLEEFEQVEMFLDYLGAGTTILLWCSLLGYLVEWWCGMAVAFGTMIRVFQAILWLLLMGAMGIVATTQILYTFDDCSQDICPISDSYSTIYLTILGEPVLTDYDDNGNNDTSHKSLIVLSIFSLLFLWWILSILVLALSEAQRLDRHQLALVWYWEPKTAIIWTTSSNKDYSGDMPLRLHNTPTCMQRYCESMEAFWHVLTVSFQNKGDSASLSSFNKNHHHQQQREVYWYTCCLRYACVRCMTPIFAIFILPIWFLLGMATFGFLWPPQLRHWLFGIGGGGFIGRKSSARSSISSSKTIEDRLTRSKLSQLKGEWHKFQEMSMERNGQLQKDVSQIKDILIRAMLEDDQQQHYQQQKQQ